MSEEEATASAIHQTLVVWFILEHETTAFPVLVFGTFRRASHFDLDHQFTLPSDANAASVPSTNLWRTAWVA